MTAKRLPWDLIWTDEPVQTIVEPCTISTINNGVSLTETDNFIFGTFSLSQFTQFLSIIEVGAELLYPEERTQILMNFMSMVVCDVDLCQQIVDNCLSDAGFMSALVGALSDNGVCTECGTDVPASGAEDLVLADNSGSCSDAVAYGMAFNTVGFVHQTCQDFLEGIQAGFSIGTIVVALMSASPVMAYVSTTLINEVAEWFDTNIIPLYEAAFDLTTQSQIACELYCLIKDDCIITVGDVRTAYTNIINQAGYSPGGSFGDFLQWLIAVVPVLDTVIVSVFHIIIVEVWKRLSTWLDSPSLVLSIAAQTADPITPPASCDCADTQWCYEWDFIASDGGWDTTTPNRNQGEYAAGIGWQAEWGVPDPNPDSIGNDPRCYIESQPFASTGQFGQIDVDFVSYSGGSNRKLSVILMNAGVMVQAISWTWTQNTTGTHAFQFGDSVGDELRIHVTSDLTSDPTPNLFTITKATASGSGVNPVGLDNC